MCRQRTCKTREVREKARRASSRGGIIRILLVQLANDRTYFFNLLENLIYMRVCTQL